MVPPERQADMCPDVSCPNVSDWKRFGVSIERGFLPDPDPLRALPQRFRAWEEVGAELPKLLVANRVERAIAGMPMLDARELDDERALRRAMVLLSYLGHAWVWGGREPRERIPAVIARPWCTVAERLGRPPVLSYASYALDNWRRFDPAAPIELDNIALLQNFFAGADEDWFVGVHIQIEAQAAPVLRSVPKLQRAARARDAAALEAALVELADALEHIVETLLRMPELCDPHTYYLRVRPYIFGWKDHPRLPDGVVYEGVTSFSGPQRFRGETGAQSSIVPLLDAIFGVAHADDPLRAYLREMRDYMPPGHRAFLAAVERGTSAHEAVSDIGADHPTLVEALDCCLRWLEEFRSIHLEYAARYIHRQAQRSEANPTAVGTGGTPFMPYLAKHRDETRRRRPSAA